MSNNEERAWEEWEREVQAHLARLRAACFAVEATVRLTRSPGWHIADATKRMEEAADAIWKIRHGPEQPE